MNINEVTIVQATIYLAYYSGGCAMWTGLTWVIFLLVSARLTSLVKLF